nr:MAG TPA: allergen [Caudoviricetes sp.]
MIISRYVNCRIGDKCCKCLIFSRCRDSDFGKYCPWV